MQVSGERSVRLALLGCGWIAGNRLRQIASDELAEVVGVADSDPRAIEAVRRWAPRARSVTRFDELNRRDLDALMISTPSALHCEQAVTALRLGIPVFVQKPLALCAEDVGRLLQLAASSNLPVGTDLCYRHLESAGAVRHQLRSSSIGAPFRVEGWFHNAYRPGSGWSHDVRLAGGGALMDLGVHLLDLVMWLTDMPLFLRDACLLRRGRRWVMGQVEDFAAVDLELENGAQVKLATSWDASTGRDAEIGLRIYGEQGSLEIRNRSGSFFDFDANLLRGTTAERLAADEGDTWQAGPLRQWLARVARGAGYREIPWVHQTMALIDRAYEVARTCTERPSAVRRKPMITQRGREPYTYSVEKEFCNERVAYRSRRLRRKPSL